ncbi:Heme oxygenase 2, putative isoform 2 [Theobroma cacao]|uniref:Heme oxygenase 2, putative isoform 2 n=1 Tax=Theobroma cacao TaxID=3641 RepID=A0A061FCB1_THECC|nr:Heme oxygenase 2, putative isoform 2 [Theobroma cacao]
MDKALKPPVFHPTALRPCQVSFPFFSFTTATPYLNLNKTRNVGLTILSCSNSSIISSTSNGSSINNNMAGLPVKKKRKRYRKQYPGESEGITEEMRFVAMRLRNTNGKKVTSNSDTDTDTESENNQREEEEEEEGRGDKAEAEKNNEGVGDGEAETWKPSMEGFLKYLVDSKLVFNTIERIVDESDDVAYAYFRKTGLERSPGLSKDLEWFSQQDFVIPEPSNPGVTYVAYLKELAEKSAPHFLSHFYNIYFSHIAGGQVIARQVCMDGHSCLGFNKAMLCSSVYFSLLEVVQLNNLVSEMLLEGRELEFYKWEGDVQESLKGVRDKLNVLGEHWSREGRNKCLKEAAKSFKFLGQIIRLIIL